MNKNMENQNNFEVSVNGAKNTHFSALLKVFEDEISQLKTFNVTLTEEKTKLNEDIVQLTDKNEQLVIEKIELENKLNQLEDEWRKKIDELTMQMQTDKVQLNNEKLQLYDDKLQLEIKLNQLKNEYVHIEELLASMKTKNWCIACGAETTKQFQYLYFCNRKCLTNHR